MAASQHRAKRCKKGTLAKQGKISKADKKRAKLQVEKLDKRGVQLAELAAAAPAAKPGALQAASLAEDQRSDAQAQQQRAQQRSDVDKNVVQQLEAIAGFSL
ncbi:AaceriAFR743CAp [[Ashbya] aceris (nom. inval.)]|nr:AaceriAFR743CAp [[Ashbya] aceris (nom. inval.)]